MQGVGPALRHEIGKVTAEGKEAQASLTAQNADSTMASNVVASGHHHHRVSMKQEGS